MEAENIQLRQFCEEFNSLNVAEENQKLKNLLKECRDGLEKIKHIGETKKLGAVYQVAERTLTKIDEALK